MSIGLAYGILAVCSVATAVLAWPINKDGSGMPYKGGAGTPCVRTLFYHASLGFPDKKSGNV